MQTTDYPGVLRRSISDSEQNRDLVSFSMEEFLAYNASKIKEPNITTKKAIKAIRKGKIGKHKNAGKLVAYLNK